MCEAKFCEFAFFKQHSCRILTWQWCTLYGGSAVLGCAKLEALIRRLRPYDIRGIAYRARCRQIWGGDCCRTHGCSDADRRATPWPPSDVMCIAIADLRSLPSLRSLAAESEKYTETVVISGERTRGDRCVRDGLGKIYCPRHW